VPIPGGATTITGKRKDKIPPTERTTSQTLQKKKDGRQYKGMASGGKTLPAVDPATHRASWRSLREHGARGEALRKNVCHIGTFFSVGSPGVKKSPHMAKGSLSAKKSFPLLSASLRSKTYLMERRNPSGGLRRGGSSHTKKGGLQKIDQPRAKELITHAIGRKGGPLLGASKERVNFQTELISLLPFLRFARSIEKSRLDIKAHTDPKTTGGKGKKVQKSCPFSTISPNSS